MQPLMADAEVALLTSFLRQSRRYFEFGCGGSTFVASRTVAGRVTAVDSSAPWLERMREACRGEGGRAELNLIHVDIGPVGELGMPVDPATRDRWPAYYETVWRHPGSLDADLFLVDGRFRVACFMKTLLNCSPDAVIMIHDFTRPYYQVIRQVAREIASVDSLSAFLPKPGQSRELIADILERHRFEAG